MSFEADDLERVQAAVRGDAVALKLLLLAGHGRLCAVIGRRIPADLRALIAAEDVAQETYIQVFQHVKKFIPRGPDAFTRWVATIALRRLRQALARQRAAKRGGTRTVPTGNPTADDSMVALLDLVAAPGPTPSRVLARRDALQIMQSALESLPEHYRQAVVWVHIEGRPVAEAAALMGRTERAIHGLCRSGLKRLRAHLGSVSQFLSTTD